MEKEIDVKRRKPRKTYGTPSYRYRNYFALGFIITGCSLFAAFACTPIYQQANEKIKRDFMTPSEEQIAKRYLFSLFPRRRGDDIIEIMKEDEDARIER